MKRFEYIARSYKDIALLFVSQKHGEDTSVWALTISLHLLSVTSDCHLGCLDDDDDDCHLGCLDEDTVVVQDEYNDDYGDAVDDDG